jgi:hypothetical protein
MCQEGKAPLFGKIAASFKLFLWFRRAGKLLVHAEGENNSGRLAHIRQRVSFLTKTLKTNGYRPLLGFHGDFLRGGLLEGKKSAVEME